MKTCKEEFEHKGSTNLTGMQLLNRGAERENQLVALGFGYNREVSSYVKSDTVIGLSIRMINLLAYNEQEWSDYIESITPFNPQPIGDNFNK